MVLLLERSKYHEMSGNLEGVDMLLVTSECFLGFRCPLGTTNEISQNEDVPLKDLLVGALKRRTQTLLPGKRLLMVLCAKLPLLFCKLCEICFPPCISGHFLLCVICCSGMHSVSV